MGVRRQVRSFVNLLLWSSNQHVSNLQGAYSDGLEKVLDRLDTVQKQATDLAERGIVPLYIGAVSLLLTALALVVRVGQDVLASLASYTREVMVLSVCLVAACAYLGHVTRRYHLSRDLDKDAQQPAVGREPSCSGKDRPTRGGSPFSPSMAGCTRTSASAGGPDGIGEEAMVAGEENVSRGDGETPMLALIKKGHIDEVKGLLARVEYRVSCKKWMEMPCVGGATPLMYASLLRDRSLFQLLMDLGASIHAEDLQGHTVLLHTALCQSRTLFRALLSEGAHVRDTEWHRFAEAAMELQPLHRLAPTVLRQPGPQALQPLLHEALLQRPAERAQKAWTFISDLRLDQLINLEQITQNVRHRLVHLALLIAEQGHPECLRWASGGAVCNCRPDPGELLPEGSVAVVEADREAASKLDHQPEGEASPEGRSEASLASRLAAAPAGARLRLARFQEVSPESAKKAALAEARRLLLSPPGRRPFDVVWLCGQAPAPMGKQAAGGSAGTSPKGAAYGGDGGKGLLCGLWAAMREAGLLEGRHRFRSASKAGEVLDWAEAHPGRLLLLVEGAGEDWPDSTKEAWDLQRLAAASVQLLLGSSISTPGECPSHERSASTT